MAHAVATVWLSRGNAIKFRMNGNNLNAWWYSGWQIARQSLYLQPAIVPGEAPDLQRNLFLRVHSPVLLRVELVPKDGRDTSLSFVEQL